MAKKLMVGAVLMAGLLALPLTSFACDGAGPSTHIGKVSAVDAKAMKFTITDVQSKGPITFVANEEILKNIQDAKGMVTVKYEEKNGGLTALGVTF